MEQPWERGSEAAYEEMSVLGSGAYGTVYCARHRRTGRLFAKKKVSVPISEEGMPQSLIREISTLKHLAILRHPNIVHLVDVIHGVSSDGTTMAVNMIFEKCDWDLYDFLQRLPSNLPEAQIRLYMRQLLSGTDFLHSNNIIHRDLKPQNILVNKDGTVKIHDFGLARTYSHLASFTTVVVTLWYRSPELLLQGSYASPVDLWSLGCIFGELWSRQAMFQGRNEREQLGLIFKSRGLPSEEAWPADAAVLRNNFPTADPAPLGAALPDLTPSAHALLNDLLSLEPGKRPTALVCLQYPFFTSAPLTPPSA